jgi:fructokinase
MDGKVIKIGVDIGGTKTEIIALDNGLNELYRKRTLNHNDYNGNLDNVLSLVREAENTLQDKGTLGFGIRGWVRPETTKVTSTLSWLNDTDFIDSLSEKLDRPIRIENDAKCFAISESLDGGGRNYKSGFYAIIGTGAGGGIVFNRTLYRGQKNLAGEWGQLLFPYSPDELNILKFFRPDLSARPLNIEDVVSGPAWEKCYQNYCGLHDRVPVSDIMAKYRNGEREAIFVFDMYTDFLTRALAQIVNLILPDVVVIGGGVSRVPELYQILREKLKHHVMLGLAPDIRSAIHGDSSGVRGAALLWELGNNQKAEVGA